MKSKTGTSKSKKTSEAKSAKGSDKSEEPKKTRKSKAGDGKTSARPKAKRSAKKGTNAAVSGETAETKKTKTKKKTQEPIAQQASPKPAQPVKPPVKTTPPSEAKEPPVKQAPVVEKKPDKPPQQVYIPPTPAPPPPLRKKIKINEIITVKELAEKMNIKVTEVIKKLMSLGIIANLNQRINTDAAVLLADAFSYDVEIIPLYADEALTISDDEAQLLPRPPVVTIMGHVDHGKTSLLDAIREARVAEKEAGGITQHIGAYQTKTEKGIITFLDTPGHEAFTSMRARGAQATDLVVLVVAADDGVMPQTIEALDHARAAGVPIVVAINKCDLPTANPQKVKQELANLNLLPEDWGGKTIMVEVSARQQTNLDKLLEMILLESELLELKANPNRTAQGIVVEARLDPRRGPVATVLIQKGTLKISDAFVCGLTAGKIRALTDYRGQRVKEAGPSFPVEILGLASTPQTGDKLVVTFTDRESREIAERRQTIAQGEAAAKKQHLTLEAFHQEAAAGKVKSLPIILKADVQGSLEAVRDALEKFSTEEISVKVIHSGVGGINNSDVVLADASNAVILGFNVRPDPNSEELARRTGVDIKTYRIIYEMVNNVKAALEGLLDPEEKEVTVGWADIRQVFRMPKLGAVAGCMITEGKAVRTGKARVIRNGAIVYEGGIGGLRRFKDDAKEVDKGYECGISLGGFQDLKVGDRIEIFIVEKRARKL